jgi:hypothetical protein
MLIDIVSSYSNESSSSSWKGVGAGTDGYWTCRCTGSSIVVSGGGWIEPEYKVFLPCCRRHLLLWGRPGLAARCTCARTSVEHLVQWLLWSFFSSSTCLDDIPCLHGTCICRIACKDIYIGNTWAYFYVHEKWISSNFVFLWKSFNFVHFICVSSTLFNYPQPT